MEKEEEIKRLKKELEEYKRNYKEELEENYKLSELWCNSRERIRELEERLELIKNYYEENSLIKRIKFYIKYIKEKWKNANYRNNRENDTSRNNTICNDGTSNTWNNKINSLFNDKKVEKEK